MKWLLPLAARRAWLPLALLATACDRPEAPLAPAVLLSKPQVTSVLIATHLLESRIESSHLSPDSARALFLSEQRIILQRHHIAPDDSAFERSYRYYAVHDKDMEEIYKIVIDSLQKQVAQYGPSKEPLHH